jgi:hypothetical protein
MTARRYRLSNDTRQRAAGMFLKEREPLDAHAFRHSDVTPAACPGGAPRRWARKSAPFPRQRPKPKAAARAALPGRSLAPRTGILGEYPPNRAATAAGPTGGGSTTGSRGAHGGPAPARPPRLCRPQRWSRARGQRQRPGPNGSPASGPKLTDRRQPGPKRHRVVERAGSSLAVLPSAANVQAPAGSNRRATPSGPFGRRWGARGGRASFMSTRRASARAAPCRCGITLRIVQRETDSRERQGRYRWVAECPWAWLHGYRRLRIRDERREYPLAFLLLSCALILELPHDVRRSKRSAARPRLSDLGARVSGVLAPALGAAPRGLEPPTRGLGRGATVKVRQLLQLDGRSRRRMHGPGRRA